MPNYCVNSNAQQTDEHEVYDTGNCSYLPDISNQIDLGWHPDCKSAVNKAKQYYSNVDGCKHCVPDCHTR